MNKRSNQELASLIIIFVFGYSVMVFLLNHFLKPMMTRRVEGFGSLIDYLETAVLKTTSGRAFWIDSDCNDNPQDCDLKVWDSVNGGKGGAGVCNEAYGPDGKYNIGYMSAWLFDGVNHDGYNGECCHNHTLGQRNCKHKGGAENGKIYTNYDPPTS